MHLRKFSSNACSEINNFSALCVNKNQQRRRTLARTGQKAALQSAIRKIKVKPRFNTNSATSRFRTSDLEIMILAH